MNFPERVRIFIFSSKIDWKDFDYDPNEYGAEVSEEDNILVNKIDGGYSVVYMSDVFEELDVGVFGDTLIQLLTANLPGKVIEIEAQYFPMDDFSEDCGKAILQLDNYFQECDEDLISYITSASMAQLISGWDEDEQEFDFSNSDEDDDDDYYTNLVSDDDEYYESDDTFADYAGISKKKKSKRKVQKRYKPSRLIQSSSKIKKNLKRHNVIVSSDKSARKRDAETIAQFLKDFIPGKEYRDFRKDLLFRWMNTLTITKKSMKKLQKAHENQYNKGSRRKKRETQNRVLDIASRVFGGYDLFSDPNR